MCATVAETSGPFWSPPISIPPSRLNPVLQGEVTGSRRLSSYKAYILKVFDDLDEPPSGAFEIVFDMKLHIACAIYEAEVGEPEGRRELVCTQPTWFSAATLKEAANVFFQNLVDNARDE